MSRPASSGATLDLLCIACQGGTLALAATDVVAVREAEELPSLEQGVPVLALAALLGPGQPGAPVRRIRVASTAAPVVDIVTDGALLVRTVPSSSLHAVPAWLHPLVAPLGAERFLLEADGLVIVADTARLVDMCGHVGESRSFAAVGPGVEGASHG